MANSRRADELPLRVGIVFAAFPAADTNPYKYFLLLLNRLQRTCQFELFDIDENDAYIRLLRDRTVSGERARHELAAFGGRVREQIAAAIEEHDLSPDQPHQLIVVTGATLSDHHYLIRRGQTTLLALGDWDRFMAPPSLAEFLQLLVLRAAYSALEGSVWQTIHLGNRACIFDYTENLENTRYMVLTGVGVCSDCEAALRRDGFGDAVAEIRQVASREWRGDRTVPGSPANVMARFGYDLFLTRGFEPSLRERLRQLLADDLSKKMLEFLFAVLLAWVLLKVGVK